MLYRQPILNNRLRWLGHIWRSSEDNPIKILTVRKPDGARTKGRPPTRWLDDIEKDLITLKIKNWRAVAKNRKPWKEHVVQAIKACKELLFC
ncbi:uncharacterized protein TNCV_4106231 [Trichonephila clavipes]|nr:uncharacterized protein TNCV_4106231 [Trichonephila clavipes]